MVIKIYPFEKKHRRQSERVYGRGEGANRHHTIYFVTQTGNKINASYIVWKRGWGG